jgi:hypothetical protein
MKGRNVFIEIDSKEVQVSDACFDRGAIMLQFVIEVVGGLGSDRPDLFIAPGIARDKEDGDTAKLRGISGASN